MATSFSFSTAYRAGSAATGPGGAPWADSTLNVRTRQTEAVTSRIIALLSSRRRSMFEISRVSTAASVSLSVSPSKGGRPVIISHTTPNAQMSARLFTSRPRACSGAMSAAVPRVNPVAVTSTTAVARRVRNGRADPRRVRPRGQDLERHVPLQLQIAGTKTSPIPPAPKKKKSHTGQTGAPGSSSIGVARLYERVRPYECLDRFEPGQGVAWLNTTVVDTNERRSHHRVGVRGRPFRDGIRCRS